MYKIQSYNTLIVKDSIKFSDFFTAVKMSLKLYYDLLSQPSRALYILLKSIQYKFEQKPIALRQAEHYSDEFTKINRLQKVPVIDHNGFILAESVAILKYLSRENIIPETLYPKETKQQARLEEFLEWQHIGLRLHCAMYFRVKYMDPIISGRNSDAKTIAGYEKRMMAALNDLDTKWLGRGHDFVVGNAITVADLMAACELEQPRIAGFDPKDKYPNIAIWWQKVRDYYNPHYDEATAVVYMMIEKQKQKSKI